MASVWLRHRAPSAGSEARRRSPLIGLTVLALVGLVLVVVDWHELTVSGEHLRTALGESLIVAAALGLTVDLFYKRELARDAFEASLGYLLPDALKAELRWIYGQQIICVEHEMRVRIESIDEPAIGRQRRVRVSFEIWRTMRNVSNEPVEHPTFSSVEEWFRGEASEVEPIEWVRNGEHHFGGDEVRRHPAIATRVDSATSPVKPSQLDAGRPGVERELKERILLGPGEQVQFRYRGSEIHFESGAFYETFGAPTCAPVVHVEASDGFETRVAFANRGRDQVIDMGGRATLPTVLLPYQPIVVRWWPEQRHREWMDGRIRRRDAGLQTQDP